MLKHLIKVAFRNFWKYKTFSLLNVTGLAIGMAGTLLLLLWVENQLSIDQFHAKKDCIYKVFTNQQKGGDIETLASVPAPIYSQLKNGVPEIVSVTRIKEEESVIQYGEKRLNANGNYVDPGFLNMFSFPLISNNQSVTLTGQNNILVTQQLSQEIFGSIDPVNKVIVVNGESFIIKGVLKDLPNNTKFKFDYLVPWNMLESKGFQNASWESRTTAFVELRSGVDPNTLNEKIKSLIVVPTKDAKAETVFLYPLTKLWLNAEFQNGKPSSGMINLVRMIELIAFIILLIACINFINLSTARSLKRAKEVGLRKVIGASKSTLIGQFIGESVFIAFIAGLIALGIVLLVLPSFNLLTEKKLSISFWSPYFYLGFGVFIGLTGLLAGIYPSFFLSSFKPVKALKGIVDRNNHFLTPGRVLFVIQFTIAVILINMSILIGRQINHLQERELGFNKENLVFHTLTKDIQDNYLELKDALMATGIVKSISLSNVPITRSAGISSSFKWNGKDPSQETAFRIYNVKDDFLTSNGIALVEGQDLAGTASIDSNKCLINETAAKLLRFRSPVGQILASDNNKLVIAGVVKDFLTASPLQAVEPVIIKPGSDSHILNIRLNNGTATVRQIEVVTDVIKKYNPSFVTELLFADQDFTQRVKGLKVTASLTKIFCFLSIFVACLGLFGLLLFNTEARAREISIRKVFGAGLLQISTLLSRTFVRMVIVSICIASPIAWLLMSAFLRPLYYRTPLNPFILIEAGIIGLFITISTIGIQSIKASWDRPIDSLRES